MAEMEFLPLDSSSQDHPYSIDSKGLIRECVSEV